MIAPTTLSADYSFAKLSVSLDFANIINLILSVITLLISTVLLAKRNKHAVWGIWMFIAFLPSSNLIFPIGVGFAERLAYLPSMAFCGALASILCASSSRLLMHVSIYAIVLLYVSFSLNRSTCWQNNWTLWSCDIGNSATSAKAQLLYARQLSLRGDLKLAESHVEKSLNIAPNYLDAGLLLQRIYQRQQRFTEAVNVLEPILRTHPNNLKALDACGWAKFELGQLGEADSLFIRALKIQEKYQSSLLGRYRIARAQHKYQFAQKIESLLSKKAKLDPRYLASDG
jgi:tetratricopeptide (TPR) repeat protein